MHRVTLSHGRRHANAALGFNFVDIEHLAVVEDAKVDRLFRVGHQFFKVRPRTEAYIEARKRPDAEIVQLHSKSVMPRLVPVNQSMPFQVHHQAVDRALMHFHDGGDFRQAGVIARLCQGIDNGESTVEDLHSIKRRVCLVRRHEFEPRAAPDTDRGEKPERKRLIPYFPVTSFTTR